MCIDPANTAAVQSALADELDDFAVRHHSGLVKPQNPVQARWTTATAVGCSTLVALRRAATSHMNEVPSICRGWHVLHTRCETSLDFRACSTARGNPSGSPSWSIPTRLTPIETT